jgi:hypothetical protein
LVCTHYIQCYHQNPFRSQDNHCNIFSRNFVENDFKHFYCAWSCVVRRFLPLYLCLKISNCEWHLCKVTLCPLLRYTSAFFYFAVNLASWSLCLLNFIFMKSDTASSLVKGVMCMLYSLPFHACSIFKAVVGSVILLSLAMLHPILWLNHKLFWAVCGNCGAETSLIGLCLSLLHWNDIFRLPKCAVISSMWTSDVRICSWFQPFWAHN